MVAARHNKGAAISLLLARGADPSLQNDDHKTALVIARARRNSEAMRALGESSGQGYGGRGAAGPVGQSVHDRAPGPNPTGKPGF